MIVVEFFRDVLDGIWYYLYLFVCIIAFFYVLGIVGDNKREKINKKLKEKKTYDIESGREAQIAAMETKQVLAVDEEIPGVNGDLPLAAAANGNANVSELKQEGEEKPPEVMVLNSDGSSGEQATPQVVQPTIQPAVQPAVQPVAQPAIQPAVQTPAAEPQQKTEEPLVINSNAS